MDWLEDVVATWFLVAVFAVCGAACVARALRLPAERAAWGPIGLGLLLYAGGSTLYNLELAADNDLTFPSVAGARQRSGAGSTNRSAISSPSPSPAR